MRKLPTKITRYTTPLAAYQWPTHSVPISYPLFTHLREAARGVNFVFGVFTTEDVAIASGLTLDEVNELIRLEYVPTPSRKRKHQFGYRENLYHLLVDCIRSVLEFAEIEEKSWLQIKEEIKELVEENTEQYENHKFKE